MSKEPNATTKSRLKCPDCTVDLEKLLQDLDETPSEATEQVPARPAMAFEFSLAGSGLPGQAEDAEGGDDDTD